MWYYLVTNKLVFDKLLIQRARKIRGDMLFQLFMGVCLERGAEYFGCFCGGGGLSEQGRGFSFLGGGLTPWSKLCTVYNVHV